MSSCIKTRQGKKSSAPDSPDFLHLYRILKARFGPSGWWPGESPLEVAVGAVLTQNTAWGNVEKAIQTLKKHSMLDLGKLHAIDPGELASLIRASGYYNIKAKRLKNLVNAVADSSSGSMEAFFSQDLKSLRDILLGVNGIGKETADSICCYAAGKQSLSSMPTRRGSWCAMGSSKVRQPMTKSSSFSSRIFRTTSRSTKTCTPTSSLSARTSAGRPASAAAPARWSLGAEGHCLIE